MITPWILHDDDVVILTINPIKVINHSLPDWASSNLNLLLYVSQVLLEINQKPTILPE